MLATERRERRKGVEQLRRNLRTWAWWEFFLTARVIPLLLVVFVGWTLGFASSMAWIGKKAYQQGWEDGAVKVTNDVARTLSFTKRCEHAD